MRLRQNMIEIFNVLRQDEELLRLLTYRAENIDDDILIVTSERPNILEMNPSELYKHVQDKIVFAPKFDGLDGAEKCRVLIYPNRRRSTGNYLAANQEIFIDVLTHNSFSNDFRMETICDRLSHLLFDKRITGIQKVDFTEGGQINFNALPTSYTGYRLAFTFGSLK
ncbi:hypothetical protein PQ478_08470 [Alkalihalophilus pseudofirmus]|uniref:hypothetical protein n=1 Tax=Alkalihalophilus pseudofirmus TaxID=79885 RepID=UPI00259B4969|nr:hypothetical protein [Alkalihalophilus pseudofirmus]WEG18502.1 hypothetical protein PQ478_08470 [Alkalihalophilus pseudofirmus]